MINVFIRQKHYPKKFYSETKKEHKWNILLFTDLQFDFKSVQSYSISLLLEILCYVL